jgi:phosphatidate cytidylyltransferase
MRQRLLVTIFLLPTGIAIIYFGGPIYVALISLIMALAAWEFVKLFRSGGFQPASSLVVGGVLVLVVARAVNGFESAPWMLSLLVILAMTYHLYKFERGRDQAATDFCVSLGGILYLGWLGAYLISLRDLPNGIWWVMLVLPSVWLADSGAYFIGRSLGRHKLSPRLSPKKTWEGYIGGVVVGVLGTALMAALWQIRIGSEMLNPWQGALMGLVIAIITPLGDLGESMIKRQVNVKDSSNLIPGHGGALDRIDSWLWGATIGFHLLTWFFL